MSDTNLPKQLNNAALIQIGSGVLNVFFLAGLMSFVLSFGGGLITGVCTLGMCPIGGLCGFASLLLIPVGIGEILSGVLIMTKNPAALKVHAYVSIVQKVAILFGGLGSIIAAFMVDGMVNDPESRAFLEDLAAEG